MAGLAADEQDGGKFRGDGPFDPLDRRHDIIDLAAMAEGFRPSPGKGHLGPRDIQTFQDLGQRSSDIAMMRDIRLGNKPVVKKDGDTNGDRADVNSDFQFIL
jgi:hypothetical protein